MEVLIGKSLRNGGIQLKKMVENRPTVKGYVHPSCTVFVRDLGQDMTRYATCGIQNLQMCIRKFPKTGTHRIIQSPAIFVFKPMTWGSPTSKDLYEMHCIAHCTCPAEGLLATERHTCRTIYNGFSLSNKRKCSGYIIL